MEKGIFFLYLFSIGDFLNFPFYFKEKAGGICRDEADRA